MKHKIGSLALFLSKAILLFAVIAVFYFGQRYFYEETLFYFWGNVVIMLLYTAMLYLISRIYNGFDFGNAGIQEIIVAWVLCLVIVNVFQYFVLSLVRAAFLIQTDVMPAGGFGIMFGTQLLLVIPLAAAFNALYYYFNPAQSTIIIYGDKAKLDIYKSMIAMRQRKFSIADAMSQNEQTGVLLDAINKAEAVFFLDVKDAKQEGFLEYCYLNNKHTYVLPTFSRILYHTAGTLWLANTPVFALRKPEPDTATLMVKRFIDIIISSIAIILLSPLMLVIWCAVFLHDRHSPIYKQVRVTRGGKKFKMYKFRSMVADAEEDGIPRLTAKDDARITPIGRFIRRTRLDELPQFFNVLSGSMSLVGPRPERPEIAEIYEETYPNFAFRTKVKAGLTGYAQIFGRYNTAPEEKLFLDIMYIETFSILQDIKLLLQTINVFFKPLSTEGIEGDSTTALR